MKSGRARLAEAEQAARAEEEAIRQKAAEAQARALREVAEREEAERLARERADAEWAKLAPAVWAQAGKREWDAAIARCTAAVQDAALAPHAARLEALGRVIARARAADRAVVAGLRGALETSQTFKRRTGGQLFRDHHIHSRPQPRARRHVVELRQLRLEYAIFRQRHHRPRSE